MEGFYVYRVRLAGQMQDIVSMLPHEHAFETGLAPAAIVGVLSTPLNKGGKLEPSNFARNSAFVEFLHQFVAETAPTDPGLLATAQQVGTGWVYVIDARTPTPQGEVPPHDIIGRFGVENGNIMPASYQPNQRHQILSVAGFFDLTPKRMNQLRDDMKRIAGEPTSVG
jgi:hypothetical protein